MDNIIFIFPELFISLSIMLLLVVGVFKKKSSKVVYNLSAIFLFMPGTFSNFSKLALFISFKLPK